MFECLCFIKSEFFETYVDVFAYYLRTNDGGILCHKLLRYLLSGRVLLQKVDTYVAIQKIFIVHWLPPG